MILASILLSYHCAGLISLGVSLCLGEVIWVGGVIGISGSATEIRARLLFLAQTAPVLALPIALRYFLRDNYITYFPAFGLFGLLLVALHFQKFRSFINP
jgi:hypothetical protein